MMKPNRLGHALMRFVMCVLACCTLFAYSAGAQETLVLDDNTGNIAVWANVTLLQETEGQLSALEARKLTSHFQAPENDATLGINPQAIWLRVPLQAASSTDGKWIFDIDYPPLQKVDVALFEGETLLQETKIGSLRPFSQRPLASRTHAIPLTLKPATAYELFVRIETRGSMILPIALKKPREFHQSAINEQLLQGLLLSIAFCLVLYSLFQSAALRDWFFLKYAILVAGSTGTALLQSGIGAQYIWTNMSWVEIHIAGLASLMALGGTFLFLEEALREPHIGEPVRWHYPRIMQGGAVLVAVIAIAFAFDLFGLRVLSVFMAVLGPIPTVISFPRLIRRLRRREMVGLYLILAWTVYMVGAMTTTALVRGQLPANFWTMHSFQLVATFDMLVFLYVLTVATCDSQLAAYRARQQRDAMQSLASTDPLTGLANRRGLNEALASTFDQSTGENLAAVYVIDVDGFKPVNDRYGHDIGDKLLIAVGKRLRSNVRDRDVVARVGGDEFTIVANNVHSEQQAHELGGKLLEIFDEAFSLDTHTIHIGLTIGYAIIPLDATEPAAAVKLADAAMYSGKQAGRRCLRRAVSVRAPGASPQLGTNADTRPGTTMRLDPNS